MGRKTTVGDAHILLPIVLQMFRNGVGIAALIHAAKQAYLQTAIAELFPQGSRINVCRLSVATGIRRHQISTLLKRSKRTRTLMKEEITLRVLHGWCTDPRVHNAKGKTAELSLRGSGLTFEMLVKRYGGDVTPVAVLRELERLKAVATRHGRVRLRSAGLRALELAHRMWSPTI